MSRLLFNTQLDQFVRAGKTDFSNSGVKNPDFVYAISCSYYLSAADQWVVQLVVQI